MKLATCEKNRLPPVATAVTTNASRSSYPGHERPRSSARVADTDEPECPDDEQRARQHLAGDAERRERHVDVLGHGQIIA